jgi:hypothetical protein
MSACDWHGGGGRLEERKPSYNFTTLTAASAAAAAAAWSLQQVSILKGGVEGGKGMLLVATFGTKPALQKYTDSLSVPHCMINLNYKLSLCVHVGSIIRTCRLSGPAGLVSLSGILK